MPTIDVFVWLSVFYLLGALLNVLRRAGFAFRSQVNNYPSRKSFIRQNWDTILIRIIFGYGLFWVWTIHPDYLPRALKLIPLLPDWMANWTTIPVTLGTSFVFGVVVDVGLDTLQSIVASNPKLAFLNSILRGQLPAYDTTVVDVAKLQKRQASAEVQGEAEKENANKTINSVNPDLPKGP